MATSFRSDVRAQLYALGLAFATANPTLLKRFYSVRPGAFNELRCGYIGPLSETVTHSAGIRRRTMSPQIVLVDHLREPASETADALDDLVDAFLDYVTARPHAISNTTLTSVTAIEDIELDGEVTSYPAVILTLGETIIQEGRL